MPLCSRASRKRMALTVLAAVWAMSPLAHSANAAESYSEDAVKAAFLYRFTGYVDWPAQAAADPHDSADVNVMPPGSGSTLQDAASSYET